MAKDLTSPEHNELFKTVGREKFPTHSVFTGKDQTDREEQDKKAEKKGKEATGRKDLTNPEHNELFKTVGR